jgi:hypothetical protein
LLAEGKQRPELVSGLHELIIFSIQTYEAFRLFNREGSTFKSLTKEDIAMPRIPNQIIHNSEDNSVTIMVTRRNGNNYDVKVDAAMYDIILKYNLHIYVAPTSHNRNDFYARTYINGKQYLLHRLILEGILDDQYPEVDHINPYNTLDNRLCNLRPADRKMNMSNLKVHQRLDC